eukprot:NODE_316_length_11188_cov_0.303905.p1 type:complete len:627 gc:universal NODE_316_length_11188_cov_0.303905:3533-5413(+)
MFHLKPNDFQKLINLEQNQCKLSSLFYQYNTAIQEYSDLQNQLKVKLGSINSIITNIQLALAEQAPPNKDRSQFFNLMKNFISFHENAFEIMAVSIAGNVVDHVLLDTSEMTNLKNELVENLHKNNKFSIEYITKLQLKDKSNVQLDMQHLKLMEQQRSMLYTCYTNYLNYFKSQDYKELFEPSIMMLLYQLNYFQMNYHSLNDSRNDLTMLLSTLAQKSNIEESVLVEATNNQSLYNFNPLYNPLKYEKEPRGYLYRQYARYNRVYFSLNYYFIENGFLNEVEIPKIEKSSMMDKINEKMNKQKSTDVTAPIMDLKYCMSKAYNHPFSILIKRGLKQPEQDEIILFTENEESFNQWMIWIQRGIESGLNRKDNPNSPKKSEVVVSPLSPEENEYQSSKKLITSIHETKGNSTCCDCKAGDEQNPPEWVSCNLGIILCIECSGIHRGLGTHVSKIRSLTLDSWDSDLALLMTKLGNDCFNKYYSSGTICDLKAIRAVRHEHIIDKHVKKIGLIPIKLDATLFLAQSLRDNRYDDALLAILHNANINAKDPVTGLSLLHEALKSRNTLAIEFILLWSNNFTMVDNNYNTVLHYCCFYNYPKYAGLLLKRGAVVDALNGDGKVFYLLT